MLETPDAQLTPLSDMEWQSIRLVSDWLVEFRKATTRMSMTKAMTLSSTHAVFRHLQDHLRTSLRALPPHAAPELREGLRNAHRKLSDYYYKVDESPYLIWAASTCGLIYTTQLL